MRTNGRRLSALLLALVLAVQMLPLGALAEPLYSDPFTLQNELADQVTLQQAVTHTVTFLGQDGAVLRTLENVPDGTAVAAIAEQVTLPEIPGYVFSRWLPNDRYVTAAATTFSAQYEPAQTYQLNIRYLYQVNNSQAAPPFTGVYAHGDTFSAQSPAIMGYQLADEGQATISGTAGTAQGGANDLEYTVYYRVNTGTPYRVEHWFQAVTGPDYVLDESRTQHLTATSGAMVQVTSHQAAGFHALTPTRQVRVAPDGSTVVALRYDRDVHVITYDTSGGTFIPPYTGRYGSAVPAVAVPQRPGYQFMGWDITPPGTLMESLHITALWKAAQADYTMMYWLQNANDDGYTFKESVVKRGVTGEVAAYDEKSYPGFHLSLEKTEAATIYIQGDGSAVKNVYYDRDQYRVIFLHNNENHVLRTYPGVPQGKVIWQIWDEVHRDFPAYTWYTGTNNQEHYTFAPEMPAHDLYLYGNEKGSVPYTIYYLDNVTNANIRPPYQFTANSNVKLKGHDYVTFDGFNVLSHDKDGSQNAVYNPLTERHEFRLYYERLSYQLRYYSQNTYLNTVFTLKYDDALQASLHNITPPVPVGLEGYRFGGWYTTSALLPGTQFVWAGARMPAGDLILYASWLPPSYAVQFSIALPEGGYASLPAQDITQGGRAIRPEDPEAIPGYTFDGWYYPGTRTRYDFSASVYADIVLEGSYLPSSDIAYTVRYLDAATGAAVFPQKDVSGQITGAVVTEDALWPDNGLAPDLRQKTLKLRAGNNVITFYYAQALKEYTVRYLEEGTGVTLLPAVTRSGVSEAAVTEMAPVIRDHPYTLPEDGRLVYADFLPDNNEKTLRLTTTPSDNMLTFYYQRQVKYHYYVRFVEADTGHVLALERYVVTTHNNVVEHAPALQYYLPESYHSTYQQVGYSVSGNGAYVSTALYVTDPERQPPQTITFYYRPEKIAVTGTKTWVDSGNAYETRPDNLQLTLLADGQALSLQPPYTWAKDDAGNTWSYTFFNMPAAHEGDPFVYTVTEQAPSLYLARHLDRDTLDGTDITNTLDGGTITFSGSKTWVDEADPVTGYNARPASLQVTMLRKTTADADWAVMQPQPDMDWQNDTPAHTVWTYTVPNLNQYEGGLKVEYMARETVPASYRQTKDENGHFENQVIETTAHLKWVNGPENDRPSVWLTLYRQSGNVAAPERVLSASIKEMLQGAAQTSWPGLEQHDAQGSPYTFTVRQTDIYGNPLALADYATSDGTSLTVTNTYRIPTGSQTGTKTWAGGEYARPEALWLRLRRTAAEGTVDEPVPGAEIIPADTAAQTTHKWDDLHLTDVDGSAYTFYLEEGLLAGEDFTPAVPEHYDLSGEGTLNLVNTYRIPADKTVEATKVWQGGSEAEKPALWFRLERRVEGSTSDFGPVPGADILPVPAEAPYTTTWTNMERTNAAGQNYQFAVKEGTLDGTSFKEGPPAPFENGMGTGTLELTNTYRSPLRPDITVTKVWQTTGTGLAPTAPVTLQLMRQAGESGAPEVAGEVTLDGDVDQYETAPFKGLFTNLPLTDAEGVEYLYTVLEPDVPANYLAEYSQSTFTVTNAWQTTSFTASKAWAGGYEGMTRPAVTFRLWRESETTQRELVPVSGTVTLNGTEPTPWSYTWQNLPVYDDSKNPYTYSATEVRLPGYTPSGTVPGANTYEVTNTFEHVSVYATKVIVVPEDTDAPDSHPAFTLLLSRNEQPFAAAALNGAADTPGADGTGETAPTTDMNGNENRHYAWHYLPKYDENGEAYTYEVSEPDVPTGYVRQSVVSDGANRFTVTNEFRRDTFRAFKYWNTAAGTGDITFQLWQQQLNAAGQPLAGTLVHLAGRDLVLNGEADGASETTPQYEEAPSVTDQGWPRWAAVWTGLDTTVNGNTVKYLVGEAHTGEFAEQFDTVASASTVITNTSKNTIITGKKEWREGTTLTRPQTTLNLRRYKDGVPDDTFMLEGTLNGTTETTPWSFVWPAQPRFYDDNGTSKAYVYRVTEDQVPEGYTLTDTLVSADGTVHTLVNTYTPPMRTLTAAKVWQGGDAANRPAVTFRLQRRFRDDTASQWAAVNPSAPGHTLYGVGGTGVNPLTGAEECAPWKMRGANLPTTHIDGRAYEYRVVETSPVTGFVTT